MDVKNVLYRPYDTQPVMTIVNPWRVRDSCISTVYYLNPGNIWINSEAGLIIYFTGECKWKVKVLSKCCGCRW